MNAEIKAKWLEALRSGRYEQGSWRLRDESRFCPLGVLCDLIAPNGWKLTKRGFVHGLFRMRGTIGPRVSMKSGLGLDVAAIIWKQHDIGGMTFPQIADWIEANL